MDAKCMEVEDDDAVDKEEEGGKVLSGVTVYVAKKLEQVAASTTCDHLINGAKKLEQIAASTCDHLINGITTSLCLYQNLSLFLP